MPNQVLSSVENNFTKGLITEFTGLNFPENAATDTDNCIYTLVGDVTRREGFDYEANATLSTVDRTGQAVSTYKWNNAGGDGETQLVAQQIGGTLRFYKSSAATNTVPLSGQLLASTVDLSSFVAAGVTFDATVECQYSDGNGYLFVYHPNCDPLYVALNAGVLTATKIFIQIRDFTGAVDNLDVNIRPATLGDAHSYNLQNQGWTSGNAWHTNSSTDQGATISLGIHTWTVDAGLAISIGDSVSLHGVEILGSRPDSADCELTGVVTAYSTTSLSININQVTINSPASVGFNFWSINPISHGYINTWFSAEANYPSNADVWWYFKNSSGVFAPATTVANVTLGISNAPKGHFVLNAFTQNRAGTVGLPSLDNISTLARPRTGTWFQGRVWYAGADASQSALTTSDFYTWTENIYFSQVINTPSQFGQCYQLNDPTSETLFDLLPTDGGVIQVQGCGAIYKLFPLQNALLIFAANGVWYLTGSQGIGFTANDYTIVKLSAVKSISSTTFVDINGLPIFWNEEGIYSVEPAKQGTSLLNSPLHVNPLEVNPLTVGTILTFYNNIPLQSKKYARGAYNPIDYVVQWLYKSEDETGISDRYSYDKILNFNNSNKAFYPYSFDISNDFTPRINSIVYVSSPGGSTAPNSVFKYSVSNPNSATFAEERDDTFVDWATEGVSENYSSYFVTGFKLHGQGQRRFQIPYIYVFSRGGNNTAYNIQGLWDYAVSPDSGRWSTPQFTTNRSPLFGMVFRRHKIRGQGLVLQIKLTSVDGQPFDVMGWSSFETQNVGV